jgi:hypothetical protein
MKLGKKVLVIVLTVAALSTTAVGTALAAQGDTSTTGQNTTQTTRADRPAWAGVGRGAAGNTVDAVTDLLGMTAADIQAARQQGRSLSQIAADKDVGLETLVSTIVAQRKALLDTAVTAGRITQGQADLMLANMTSRITERVQDATVGPRSDRPAAGQRGAGMGSRQGAAQGAGQGGTGLGIGIDCSVTAA